MRSNWSSDILMPIFISNRDLNWWFLRNLFHFTAHHMCITWMARIQNIEPTNHSTNIMCYWPKNKAKFKIQIFAMQNNRSSLHPYCALCWLLIVDRFIQCMRFVPMVIYLSRMQNLSNTNEYPFVIPVFGRVRLVVFCCLVWISAAYNALLHTSIGLHA